MATPTNLISMGKYARLYVAPAQNDDTAQADSAFKLIENENDIELTYKSDKEKVSTKSSGRVTLPEGDEEWQIKVTCDAILQDAGYVNLLAAMNSARACQIRDTQTNKVIMEGKFTVSDMSMKAGATGVLQTTFTLDNSNTVKFNLAIGGRDLIAA